MEELLMNEIGAFSYADKNPQEQVKELAKALTVGYGMDPTTQVGFGATRVEDLDRVLVEMTAKTKDAKFFNAINKGKATGPVVEYAVLSELGSAAPYAEGDLPPEYDEELLRKYAQVKYIGAVGQIPYVATITESVANNIDTITKAKAAAIIRYADVLLHFGDSSKNSIEWDGFLTQFNAGAKYKDQQVIDLRGKRPTLEVLNQAAVLIQENYGNGENLKVWLSNFGYQYYINELIASKQLFMSGNVNLQDIYVTAKNLRLGNGGGSVETDIFLRHKGETYLDRPHPKLNSAGTAFAAMHEKAPKTLDANTASVSVDANAATQLDAATYDYCIVPVNKYGAGAGFEIQSVVVAASKQVTFTIADNGSTVPATKFDVYRKLHSATDKTSYRFLTSFAASAATMVDAGADIPGTTYGFIYDWDFEQVLDYKQLLPMVKMPLAVVSDSLRWLQKLYATPILKNPNKMVVLKNIGSTAWS